MTDATTIIVAAISALIAAIGIIPATLLALATWRLSKVTSKKADKIQETVNGTQSELRSELAEAMTEISELNSRQATDLKAELAIANGRILTLQALWDKRYNGVAAAPVAGAATPVEPAP